jgi:hypothetical protein
MQRLMRMECVARLRARRDETRRERRGGDAESVREGGCLSERDDEQGFIYVWSGVVWFGSVVGFHNPHRHYSVDPC